MQGKTTPCVTCHGLDLMGVADVPPIAGRSPSYIVRQIWDIQQGDAQRRRGAADEAGDREPERRRSRIDRGLCLVARAAAIAFLQNHAPNKLKKPESATTVP